MRRPRIAINGLGRIGRLVFQILFDKNLVDIVAINDIAPDAALVYLLKYDTAQGKWDKEIKEIDDKFYIEGREILSTSFGNINQLPWKDLDIDIVIECSGRYRTKDKLAEHIAAGAKKVIISAPADNEVKTIVLGINDNIISKDDLILSNASCTTNCLAPMVKILQDNYGIQYGMMNTIHAYTQDQKLHDSIHPTDFRRARAAAQNIVPTTTNASKALEWVMPEIKGKIIGGAVRVPVIAGSTTELYVQLEKQASIQEINEVFHKASKEKFKGILQYTEDPIVSSDIIHNPYSCIFDAGLTQQNGGLTKIVGWYDNEYGYANRLAELVELVALKYN
ncbi:MAG TPA: type I glyceraldehyde-3-phosphate dehydrogenase [Chitinophagales bacterium]|nr:type I glyceraldehyde-3-phosphate dehydrogenase [Chitinophagales bacterium]HND45437.1 type I glyceraldehyde-3-phosphate dehydrogenase [Chitinophagales bacterium]HNJ59783.1 type I glyceraldehyde-3-phosphate dehydrogenase [Chitinophagales bacterium]